MLKFLDITDFDKVFEIMEKSFPDDEYRPYDQQKELLLLPEYKIYAFYGDNKNIKGFITVWDFDSFAFIEHFAVNPRFRNSGLGGIILGQTVKLLNKEICLEVEPPQNEISVRRINFYRRNNFFLNPFPYKQPAISKGKKPIPLLIMTYGKEINKEEFEIIKKVLYKKVYNVT